MLPRKIERFLLFFDLFGFDSGSSRLYRYQTLCHLVKLVHIVTVVLLTSFTFSYFIDFYALYGIITAISQFLLYFSTLCTYWLILMDSFLHRRSHKHFWDTIQLINEHNSSQTRYALQTFTAKSIWFFVMSILLTALVFQMHNFGHFLINIAHFILIRILQIRIFYYLFCVEIVHFQFQLIENELKKDATESNESNGSNGHNCYSHQLSHTSHSCFELKRLKCARECLHCVYEMKRNVNKIFGWSHLAGIFSCFYLLICDLSWLYIGFKKNEPFNFFGTVSHRFFFIQI